MSRLKIIGYVVVTDAGDLFLGSASPDDGLAMLWFGNHASLFPTRRVAQKLIARTRQYAAKHELDWPWVDTARIQVMKVWDEN